MFKARLIETAVVTCLALAASVGATATTHAETLVRVGKPQAAAFQFAPVDIGLELGIFKKHGLDVQATDFGGGPKVQQALTAKSIDIAIGSGPELAMIGKGVPEIAVAAIADAPYPVVLAVLKDSPIKTAADLKGRPVSVSTKGSLTWWLAQELSRQQGWGNEGINIVPLGSTTAQTAALKTHQIDGMIVEINSAYRLEEEGVGRILVRFSDTLKKFHNYVLYARKDFADDHPEAVKAFLAGWFETVAYMKQNREKTIALIQKVTEVSPAIATRGYDELMGLFNPTGKFDPEALQVLSRSFVEMGLLPAAPDLKSYYTEAYLPGAK